MKVIKRVVVKQVLTEESKKELLEKLTGEIKRLRIECEQLNFEKRKSLKYNEADAHDFIDGRFTEEIRQRQQKIDSLQFQIDQLNKLPLGTEVTETELETLVDINVGDDWDSVMSPAVIVIKNGKVIALRS